MHVRVWQEIIGWFPIPRLSDCVDADAIHCDREYRKIYAFQLFVVIFVCGGALISVWSGGG